MNGGMQLLQQPYDKNSEDFAKLSDLIYTGMRGTEDAGGQADDTRSTERYRWTDIATDRAIRTG